MMSGRSLFFFFMPCSNKSMLAATHLSFSSLLLVPIPLLNFGFIVFILFGCLFSHCTLLVIIFLGGIFVFLVLLTITNDDFQSMHGGAQYGLRISAFWLLASGSCSRFASVLWFCIAFRISSALFHFAFHACSVLTAHVIIIWRTRITLLIQC